MISKTDMPNFGRQQDDSDQIFSALSTPFVSCLIGVDEKDGVLIGNDYLFTQDEKGQATRTLDPQYITGIQVTRNCPSAGDNWKFLDGLQDFLTTMAKEDTLTPEELRRAGKDSKKAAADRKKEVEKQKKEAPKKLQKFLDAMSSDLLVGPSQAAGARATINLTITSNMALLTWLYNYSIKQSLLPSIKLRYGITAGGGKRQRVSPEMVGIIEKVTVSDFFNLTLEVNFLQGNMLGWTPEEFNKIFAGGKQAKESAAKTNNPKQQKNKPTEAEKTAYKEGDVVYTTNNAKTTCYSNVVKAIAKGLNWPIGYIEPTKPLAEGAMITVEHVEEGPLAYIQKNFCGKIDAKDGDGKTVKAEAVSIGGLRDYIAFFEYGTDSKLKFYYLPRQVVTKSLISNMRVYEYTIRGTNSGEFQSEVLEFSFTPVDLRSVQYNVKKLDGHGDTNLPSVSNSRKEVSNVKTTQESQIKGGSAAQTNRAVRGTAQNPNYRSILSNDTKEAIDSYLANLDHNITNTWSSVGQGGATMKILYDESIRLMQVIYVCVLCPMNDSVSFGGQTNTKKVIHPSSGLYSVKGITDEINGSAATTTLELMKLHYTQETLNQIKEFLQENAKQAEAEQKKQKEASKSRPDDKTASNE